MESESFNAKDALGEAIKYFWTNNARDNFVNLRMELYSLAVIMEGSTNRTEINAQGCPSVERKGPGVGPYVMTATTEQATALMFLQFTLIFMSMFLPCYFVQQSTHITNSLLNGTAGLESLANATSDVIGRTSRGIQRAAGGLVSGVGNIARGINTHNSNTSQASQANAAQRTADATSAMLDMMRQGNGNNSSS